MLLAGSAAVAQAITLGVTPVLTRIFSPEEFGILAAFISALSILLAVGSLRYEFALPQAQNISQAQALVFLCLRILPVTAIMVFILTVAASLSGLELLEEWSFFWLLPVGIIFAGAFQVANYWAVRQKAFGDLARANVFRSIFQAAAQVGMGLAGVGVLALVVGYVLSQAVGAIKILSGVIRGSRIPSGRRLKVLAVRHKRFPLFSVPAGLLNVGALHLTPFLLIYFYGVASAGFFSLAQRAMGAPMAFLGMAIANVYLSELPRIKVSEPHRLRRFYLRSCITLLAIGVPLVAFATMALWWGVELAFGAQWSRVADFVIYMAPFFLGQFVVVPLSQTLNVLERQDLQLLWDFVRLMVPNLALVFCFLAGYEDVQALGVYSVSMLLVYAFNVFLGISSINCCVRDKQVVVH